VRWGCCFRSGRLDDLTDDDLAVVAGLDLALVCDLRGTAEVEARPDRLPPGVPTAHVPVHDVSASPRSITELLLAGRGDGLGAEMLERGNRAFARERSAPFAALLRHVAAAGGPVLFHCTAGKDRAGFAAATLLWALGVPTETVVEDYLLSNACLAERHATFLAEMEPRLADAEPLRAMLECRPEYLGAALEALEADHGSIDAWLHDGLGLDAGELAHLRGRCLDG
jgi:protein-tyrosine phosphatase